LKLTYQKHLFVNTQGEEGSIERTLRQSFLVSADMAHALHPNYTHKHDAQLQLTLLQHLFANM
jgi:aspartyl aminopeptidase